MANVIGSSSSLFASWEVAPPAPTLPANPPWPESERKPAEPSLELLSRVEGVLASSTSGLALGQIREELGATAAEVRAALDAGLRARTVRRVGASSTLRYVLNPRH